MLKIAVLQLPDVGGQRGAVGLVRVVEGALVGVVSVFEGGRCQAKVLLLIA